MHYGTDRVYAVEQFDRVDIRLNGMTFGGTITRLHPKAREVTVRYEDTFDTNRRTGEPKRKTARVPLADVDLVGRDA